MQNLLVFLSLNLPISSLLTLPFSLPLLPQYSSLLSPFSNRKYIWKTYWLSYGQQRLENKRAKLARLTLD